MGRRGQATLLSSWIIIELVLLLVLWFSIFNYVEDVKDGSIFEKSYVVRDLSLATETVQSVPGDLTFYYYQDYLNLWDYDYYFANNEIGISEPNDLTYRITYPYYLSTKYYTTLQNMYSPLQLIVLKEDKWFEITEYADVSFFEKLQCPDTATLFFNKDTLVIDSSLDEFPLGLEAYFRAKLDFTKKSTTRQGATYEFDVIEEDTNLLLSLDKSDEVTDKTAVTVKIPLTNKEQNEKLACLILNSLLNYFPEIEITAPQESNDEVLNKNPNGLAIQLIFTNPTQNAYEIGAAIEQGIQEYYQQD